MKEVFIKYNPYKLVTEVRIDGKALKSNSDFHEYISDGTRLQEWVEELPELLIGECNDKEFDITFHGTTPDYEDLSTVIDEASHKGFVFTYNFIPAKETEHKEKLIHDIFMEIRNGPIEDLKGTDIMNAFRHAESNEFEVSVVATMSAGKSTLINAMLGRKLMPSKNAACTAKITRVTSDSDAVFRAEVYDENNKLLESHQALDLRIMDRLNESSGVSTIKVFGGIPFVDANRDMTLVLVDTPGPNNSRNPEHQRVQRKMLDSSSKTLVLYVMNATQLAVDDDNALLRYVSESMKVGGKQSKDRFIFVVNKLDNFKPGEDDVESALGKVKDYLKSHGINKPNVFPVAALPALMIRMMFNGADLNEYDVKETDFIVEKLNSNESLHLEAYAPLVSGLQGEINTKLKEVRQENNAEAEALIHTGVVSVEKAILQYVRKYAKTAKIKNVVDTFIHRLDDAKCFEAIKKEMTENIDNYNGIVANIEKIRAKIDDANEAKNFKDTVANELRNVLLKTNDETNDLFRICRSRITALTEAYKDREVFESEINEVLEELRRLAMNLEIEFQVEMEKSLGNALVHIGQTLAGEYKNKIAVLSVSEELSSAEFDKLEPLKLINAHIDANLSLDSVIRSREVQDGTITVRKEVELFNIFTWPNLFMDFWTEKAPRYKTVKYIDKNLVADVLAEPLEKSMRLSGREAFMHMMKQKNIIEAKFSEDFKLLDDLLKKKLTELENCATDRGRAEERLKESRKNLDWIDYIKSRVEEILEI